MKTIPAILGMMFTLSTAQAAELVPASEAMQSLVIGTLGKDLIAKGKVAFELFDTGEYFVLKVYDEEGACEQGDVWLLSFIEKESGGYALVRKTLPPKSFVSCQ